MVGTLFFEGSTMRDSSNSGTKQEGLTFCTRTVKEQLRQISILYSKQACSQGDNTLPELNNHKRIACRTMREVFRDAN